MASVLIVDDEGKIRSLVGMALSAEGFEPIHEAASAEAALDLLKQGLEPDVIISDIRMAGATGLELLREVKSFRPAVEVILMTAYADAKTGVEAMKNGAYQYVTKPFEMDELVLLAKAAAEKKGLKSENRALKAEVKTLFSLSGIIGRSARMQDVIRQIRMVGPKETTVIIRGKSGTGKELVARALHAESGRREFVAINCSTLPGPLLESELFGHEKGAFTGAHRQKAGLFEEAGAGTIFLDEIGDLPSELQAKLLRVLQERTFRRVGGSEDRPARARIISATNRNLEDAVQDNRFREDLYYRLNVFPLFLPSLAERREDIPEIARHLLVKYGGTALTASAENALSRYGWPGNVRELENVIQQALILSGNTTVDVAHLPLFVREGRNPSAPSTFALPETGISLEQVEKEFILQALQKADGNKTRAAELLGISRRAIYSKMKTHNLETDEKEQD